MKATAETNINNNEVEKMREEARITVAGEEETHTGCKDGTYKWAMGTFPPISNSKLVEEVGTFAVDAFNTVQEWISQDELTAEQEQETKAALDEILAIFQIVQKLEQERWKHNYSRSIFSPKGGFL